MYLLVNLLGWPRGDGRGPPPPKPSAVIESPGGEMGVAFAFKKEAPVLHH